MEQYSYVYILTTSKNSVLYTGVTANLIERVWQHKNKLADGFTKKYNVDKLVYFEQYEDIMLAIEREKKLKRWKKAWKHKLIEENNPNWSDLFETIGC